MPHITTLVILAGFAFFILALFGVLSGPLSDPTPYY
jgi:hypothetical protein